MHVSVQNLHANPGQMRTALDLDQLAQLALQIAERGMDADRSLLVTQAGDDGIYRVVRGHRRWLAAMIAEHARTLHDEMDVETMRQVVEDLVTAEVDVEVCGTCGSVVEPLSEHPVENVPGKMLEEPDRWRVCENCNAFTDQFEPDTTQVTDPDHVFALYTTLPDRYPHLQLPVIVQQFESALAEQLSLIGDNCGGEEPDLLGQVRGFRYALERGATLDQLAAATGQSVQRVKGVVALSDVSPEFAEYIAESEASPQLAHLATRLDGLQQQAFETVVMQRELSLKDAREAANRLQEFAEPVPGLPIGTPEEINHGRARQALWREAKEIDEAAAWQIVARGWDIELKLAKLIGLVHDYRLDAEHLTGLVPEMSCDKCRLRELLRELPKLTFHPGYPCQGRSKVTGCDEAVAEGDPFYVRVGSDQAGPSAKERGHRRYYDDEAALREDLAAWVEAQRAAGEEVEEAEEETSPTDEGRAMIRSFVRQHDELYTDHPLATRCADCAHRLDESPVKADPDAPHCAWAKGRKTLYFHVWQDREREDVQIPFCRQYAPTKRWKDIVPAYPGQSSLPAEWLRATIEMLAKDYRRREYHGGLQLLERLTGRPLKADEDYAGWFLDMFEAQGKELSVGQLVTLLMWLTLYLGRQRGGEMLTPLPQGVVARWELKEWPFEPDFEVQEAD